MDVVFSCVAGMDVHKRTVVVCVRTVSREGTAPQDLVRTFRTMTRDLREMAEWLKSHGVTHVAMESTGVYWKPIWNLLEGQFELMLVNAHELKQVPGRKSDIRDCQWIAQLLQHGLLRSSFVPSRDQRELRDLTRYRTQLEDESTRVVNRIQKILEDANIKLASVASDVQGKSGRAMLEALVRGNSTPEQMAELARGRLRGKIPELRLALEGLLRPHHQFMIQHLLRHLDLLQEQIAQLDGRIGELMAPFLPAETAERLDEIPGVNQRTIENVIAEIGTDMNQFPSDAHISSWAGVCPGNEVSAGKRKRSQTTKGNKWLRRALTQSAWSGQSHQGQLLQSPIRPAVRTPREETRSHCSGSFAAGGDLPSAQLTWLTLPRSRTGLFPSPQARAEQELPGQATGEARIQGTAFTAR